MFGGVALVTVAISAAPAFAFVSFTGGTVYPGGGGPTTVAVADLNGDSHHDLVVANTSPPFTSVLLGDGNAGFSAPANFSSDGLVRWPSATSTATRALMSGTTVADQVDVLLNTGNGNLGPAATFATGPFPMDIAVGHFNGDSSLDLVTTNSFSSHVSILLGNGAGSFSGHVEFAAGGTHPSDVSVGDLDGDSQPDLVVAHDGGVSVLTGDSAGGFSSPATIAFGVSNAALEVADFNEDGAPDFAVSRFDDGPLVGTTWVFLNDGTGGFSGPTIYEKGGVLVVADFDSDSHLDMAVSAEGASGAILAGDGTGDFSESGDSSAGRPRLPATSATTLDPISPTRVTARTRFSCSTTRRRATRAHEVQRRCGRRSSPGLRAVQLAQLHARSSARVPLLQSIEPDLSGCHDRLARCERRGSPLNRLHGVEGEGRRPGAAG